MLHLWLQHHWHHIMVKYLFVDLETNGLPRRQDGREDWSTCRTVALAWRLQSGKSVADTHQEEYAIIRPEGWVIRQDTATIHGITHAKAQADGTPFGAVAPRLLAALEEADFLVCHNLEFNRDTLINDATTHGFPRLAELLGEKPAWNISEQAKKLLKIETSIDHYRRVKFPELYYWCARKELPNYHQPESDTKQLAKIFFFLQEHYPVEDGYFTIQAPKN